MLRSCAVLSGLKVIGDRVRWFPRIPAFFRFAVFAVTVSIAIVVFVIVFVRLAVRFPVPFLVIISVTATVRVIVVVVVLAIFAVTAVGIIRVVLIIIVTAAVGFLIAGRIVSCRQFEGIFLRPVYSTCSGVFSVQYAAHYFPQPSLCRGADAPGCDAHGRRATARPGGWVRQSAWHF